jgi:hypothetical protein
MTETAAEKPPPALPGQHRHCRHKAKTNVSVGPGSLLWHCSSQVLGEDNSDYPIVTLDFNARKNVTKRCGLEARILFSGKSFVALPRVQLVVWRVLG